MSAAREAGAGVKERVEVRGADGQRSAPGARFSAAGTLCGARPTRPAHAAYTSPSESRSTEKRRELTSSVSSSSETATRSGWPARKPEPSASSRSAGPPVP